MKEVIKMTTIDYIHEQIKQIMEISSANNNYQYDTFKENKCYDGTSINNRKCHIINEIVIVKT